MEILAQKQRGLLAQYIIATILVAFIIGFEIIMLTFDFQSEGLPVFILWPVIILAAVYIAITAVCVVSCVRIKKTPDRITLDGNRIDLGNGLIVNLSQIENVDYREARNRYRQRWGTLTVYLQNQKIVYYYMADVQRARDRIMQLVWQTGSR